VHYCGIVAVRDTLQLAMLEEVRRPEPPIHLSAMFFEPGSAAQVAAELRSLGEVVVAVAGPLTEAIDDRPQRACDTLLLRRGVAPEPPNRELLTLAGLLPDLAPYRPDSGDHDGAVPDGVYQHAPLFETNADGVYCALQGRRLPAKRHPLGMQLRIDELTGDCVLDEGGDLWHRRIEELDAAACALCAHRYAVGHASWLGDPAEAVVVLPGSSVPDEFPTEGVMPPVERLQLPPVTEG
jgi:predicted nuclease with RNAse H fold